MENISTLNSQSSLQLSKTIQDFALAADFGSVLVDIHERKLPTYITSLLFVS